VDAIKQLYEANLIVGCQKSEMKEWIGANFGMKENDIKFRMIRQSTPEAARWADTTYHKNPEGAEKIVKKLKVEQLHFIRSKSVAGQQKKKQIKLIL
jgi:hypothetical protein